MLDVSGSSRSCGSNRATPRRPRSVDHQHRALQALHEATERSRHGRAPTSGASLHASTGHTAAMRSVPDGATLLPVPSGADPITRRPGLRRPLTAVGLAVALAGAGVAVNAVVASRSSGSSSRPVATAAPRGTTDRATQGRAARASDRVPRDHGRAAPEHERGVHRRAPAEVVFPSPRPRALTGRRWTGRGAVWDQVSAASGGSARRDHLARARRAPSTSGPATVRLGNAAADLSVDARPSRFRSSRPRFPGRPPPRAGVVTGRRPSTAPEPD